ncbi:MAG TPA: glutamyl-tRNA reductase, partial [Waddliaceae bacterium]
DCFFHLARVTAGVDSALVGETEIQGQVKRAYEMAHTLRSLDQELHFLFQKCLKIGKNVRSNTEFSYGLPSIEEAILNVGKKLLGNLEKRKILFVGLSEINHKIFVHFKQMGCCNISLCNRSTGRALEMAQREAVGLLPWEQLPQWMTFDVAIFGTKCPNFLVSKDHLKQENFCKLVIDLSVPRNVDPKIGRLPHLTLLNVDQLNQAIDRKRKLKAAEIARVETQIIAAAVEKQISIYRLKELQKGLRPLALVS